MAGPAAAPKINTVKTIIGEQVSDLAPNPAGTEFNIYTFNAGSPAISPLVEGKFFANQVMPAVNGLAATGAGRGLSRSRLWAPCRRPRQNKFDGDVWLYTDGDSGDSLRPEQLRQHLNEQRVRASIVLLGGCGSPARKPSEVSGSEETYLKLAADGSQPSGMVPYLLGSMLTGGQFIYVSPDQLANAVDMVRAQLSHTAGAGRWSDYVEHGVYLSLGPTRAVGVPVVPGRISWAGCRATVLDRQAANAAQYVLVLRQRHLNRRRLRRRLYPDDALSG